MRLHKLKASDTTGTYLVDSPVTENDILLMARQLASLRLRKGRALTSPKEVFSHLQALLADYEHEVFALLMLDSRHRVIAFEELFRGTLDGASVYPREVVKLALEHNAAALILVHNHPSGDPEPSMADRNLTVSVRPTHLPNSSIKDDGVRVFLSGRDSPYRRDFHAPTKLLPQTVQGPGCSGVPATRCDRFQRCHPPRHQCQRHSQVATALSRSTASGVAGVRSCESYAKTTS